jgi:hypothetical protein
VSNHRIARAFLACLAVAGIAEARLDATTTLEAQQARANLISDIVRNWQTRFGMEKAGSPTALAAQYKARLESLSDERLDLASRSGSVEELDLLFVQAPIASGMTLGNLMSNRPGNVVMPVTGSGKTTKADGDTQGSPATDPDRYSDLVFTAVTPCRIYDSRFNTENIDGKPPNARWPVSLVQRVRIGPYPDYTPYGGQATACLGTSGAGTQNPPSRIAALMGAVSTVNQLGAGYLIFWAFDAANPNPYGVAQWFQPNIVQTSFVVMPTDIINPVWSNGVAGNAATHVIVDVVGYFHKPKVVMNASVSSTGTLVRGFHVVSATGPIDTAGSAEVIFDRDVSTCYYSGTLGDTTGSAFVAGEISVTLRGTNSNGVYVTTRDSAGVSTARAFFVEVTCNVQ